MASTFFGLNIGTTGIRAYQASLNTTAHNITNIGTKGYSKQTVSLIADKALSITGSYGMIGSGVAIAAITQERNVYFDDKYRYNNAILGNYQTKEYYLSCIESYLYTSDDSIGGITTSFDGFFNSLTNLTSEASDMTKRTDAVISSESFAQYVSEFANSLQKLQNEANTQVETVVAQINALGSSIASLTQQINAFEITGESANDLRDARNALLDELSQYVNIEVKEVPAGAGTGNGQFIVYIDGAMLVDSSTSYSLQCVAGGTSVNQNDIDGLYSIQWSNGQDFNMRSSTLGGSLQALLDFRDGNNEKNFTGTATSMVVDNGVTKVTLTDPSCTDLMSLNLPSTNGKIMIGNVEYAYDSFEVTIQADGTYSYEFALKGPQSQEQLNSIQYACDEQKRASVGDAVSYKGVPYYMAQLNEFVRTFSAAFNEVHNNGYDLKGNPGIDWFNVTDKVDGGHYNFDESVGTPGVTTKFSSVASKDAQGVYQSSYYGMTALNFTVNSAMLDDPSLIACMSTENGGVENNENLAKLVGLKSDNNMFKQGTPDAFLQTLISSVGIDCKQAKSLSVSQSNILVAIDNRRESVSGVDKDEEAANLVKFQNLLFAQYKVLSIMDEVLEKLINGTAV